MFNAVPPENENVNVTQYNCLYYLLYILLIKIRQYKSLFPETFKTFKIKANANIQELQTYLDEMDSIVECDSVDQFWLDSILQCIKLIEGVSSYTKYDA